MRHKKNFGKYAGQDRPPPLQHWELPRVATDEQRCRQARSTALKIDLLAVGGSPQPVKTGQRPENTALKIDAPQKNFIFEGWYWTEVLISIMPILRHHQLKHKNTPMISFLSSDGRSGWKGRRRTGHMKNRLWTAQSPTCDGREISSSVVTDGLSMKRGEERKGNASTTTRDDSRNSTQNATTGVHGSPQQQASPSTKFPLGWVNKQQASPSTRVPQVWVNKYQFSR